MVDIFDADLKMIADKRNEMSLLKVNEFPELNITSDIIEQLIPLLKLPFIPNEQLMMDIRTLYYAMVNRVQEVFGYTHVKFVNNSTIIGYDKMEDEHSQQCESIVKVIIGNYKFFTDINGLPNTTFIGYYDVDGCGISISKDYEFARQESICKATIDALYKMGVFRKNNYYDLINFKSNGNEKKLPSESGMITDSCESCETEEKTLNELVADDKQIEKHKNGRPVAKIRLIGTPTFFSQSNSTIYLKCSAIDIEKNKDINIIIYKENDYNVEKHKKMIEMLDSNKNLLVDGKEMNVEYKESSKTTNQYIILNVLQTKS